MLQAGTVPSITSLEPCSWGSWSESSMLQKAAAGPCQTTWPEFTAWGWHSFRHTNGDVELWSWDIKCGPFWHCETQTQEQNHLLLTFTTMQVKHVTNLADGPGEESPWQISFLMRQGRCRGGDPVTLLPWQPWCQEPEHATGSVWHLATFIQCSSPGEEAAQLCWWPWWWQQLCAVPVTRALWCPSSAGSAGFALSPEEWGLWNVFCRLWLKTSVDFSGWQGDLQA